MASSTVGGTSSTQNSSNSTTAALSSGLGSLNLNDFLQMLLAELQNQDPLSPMDSTTMLTQIGQISQVGATQNLTSTLDSVLLGQNINNATALIGKNIDGLADDGTEITGKVDKVTIANNAPVLNVGTETVQLSNVRAVLPDDPTTTSQTTDTAAAAAALQQLIQQAQQNQANSAATAAANAATTAATAKTS